MPDKARKLEPPKCPVSSRPIQIIADSGPRPQPDSPATERLIDACFEKMNSIYGQYSFTPENWSEMFKSSPDATKRICDIERKSWDQLTYGDLREYYDIHINLWKSFNARNNKLTDKFKKITQTP